MGSLTASRSAARRLGQWSTHSRATWQTRHAPTFRTPAGLALATCRAAHLAYANGYSGTQPPGISETDPPTGGGPARGSEKGHSLPLQFESTPAVNARPSGSAVGCALRGWQILDMVVYNKCAGMRGVPPRSPNRWQRPSRAWDPRSRGLRSLSPTSPALQSTDPRRRSP